MIKYYQYVKIRKRDKQVADSGITKRALAKSFSELMETESFGKISIGEICDRCEMNRKSFYYHFRDKQDLIIWMFKYDMSNAGNFDENDSLTDYITKICGCLYEKKSFYRKALKIEGQNSLTDYIRDIIYDRMSRQSRIDSELSRYICGYTSDAVVVSIKRWICENDQKTCEQFVSFLFNAAGFQ